jgi:hypothetical protein
MHASLWGLQEVVAQSEERLTQLQYQLRESRREMDDKVATKSREIDAQEAHFSAELVSHTGTFTRRFGGDGDCGLTALSVMDTGAAGECSPGAQDTAVERRGRAQADQIQGAHEPAICDVILLQESGHAALLPWFYQICREMGFD